MMNTVAVFRIELTLVDLVGFLAFFPFEMTF